MSCRGFTLLELLVVMAIMALMATASVTSYRTMRQGMEESSVVRNASQFVRLAYQRSKIDRVPVNVYFWNETRSIEDNKGNKLSVSGRAVAVRRLGRITSVDGQILVDEFGDLDVYGVTDDEGMLDPDNSSYQNDSGMYLYQANGNETTFARSLVSRSTAQSKQENIRMMSDPDWQPSASGGNSILAYGFYIQNKGGVTWKKGDAYGLEFGDFELPQNYVFGNSFSDSLANPIREVKVMNFNPLAGSDGGGQTVQVGAPRPHEQGELAVKPIDSTTAPNRNMNQQNN